MTSTLPPLEIRCTSSDCENGLHCFRQSQRLMMANRDRQCRTCGVQLVDWKRVHKRNPDDAPYTFRTMKYELVRHHFWHLGIDQQALNHARRKGRVGMRLAAEKRIRKSVGPAEPPFDGRQTPKSGNALYYAQHATATCCRKCILEWHAIAPGRALTEEEITYMTELVLLYIDERLPILAEDGEKVPRRPRVTAPSVAAEAV